MTSFTTRIHAATSCGVRYTISFEDTIIGWNEDFSPIFRYNRTIKKNTALLQLCYQRKTSVYRGRYFCLYISTNKHWRRSALRDKNTLKIWKKRASGIVIRFILHLTFNEKSHEIVKNRFPGMRPVVTCDHSPQKDTRFDCCLHCLSHITWSVGCKRTSIGLSKFQLNPLTMQVFFRGCCSV